MAQWRRWLRFTVFLFTGFCVEEKPDFGLRCATVPPECYGISEFGGLSRKGTGNWPDRKRIRYALSAGVTC